MATVLLGRLEEWAVNVPGVVSVPLEFCPLGFSMEGHCRCPTALALAVPSYTPHTIIASFFLPSLKRNRFYGIETIILTTPRFFMTFKNPGDLPFA